MYQPLQKISINYNPHNNSPFLLLLDYYPAVANRLKLRSYICITMNEKCVIWCVWVCPCIIVFVRVCLQYVCVSMMYSEEHSKPVFLSTGATDNQKSIGLAFLE